MSLFASIHEAPLQNFERDAPVVKCRIASEVVAHVAVDHSDAKITGKCVFRW